MYGFLNGLAVIIYDTKTVGDIASIKGSLPGQRDHSGDDGGRPYL